MSGMVRKLEGERVSLRQRLQLQRSNVIRYVAGHPGLTTGEIAKALGLRSQNVGQVLHEAQTRRVLRKTDGKWTLRGG